VSAANLAHTDQLGTVRQAVGDAIEMQFGGASPSLMSIGQALEAGWLPRRSLRRGPRYGLDRGPDVVAQRTGPPSSWRSARWVECVQWGRRSSELS
jgi:hypothetical protein